MSCPYIGQKSFWAVQIVLEGYKLFLVGPIRFGRIQILLDEVQIRFSRSNFYNNMDLSKMY